MIGRITVFLFALCLSIGHAAPSKIYTQLILNIHDPALKANIMRAITHHDKTSDPKSNETDKTTELKALIIKAMKPYGYFNGQINITQAKADTPRNIRVQTGPPVYIHHITFDLSGDGATDPAFLALKANYLSTQGDILNTVTYEKTIDNIYNLAANRGLFDTQILTKQIAINRALHQAEITLAIDTGKQYYFGPTTFTTQPFALSLLRRFLTYEAGTPYRHDRIEETQADLNRSTLFQNILINTDQRNRSTHTVPIQIKLKPQEKTTYSAALGYGSVNGLRGTLGFTRNQLNQYGHQFRTLLQAAQYNSSISSYYTLPGERPGNSHYNLSAAYRYFNQATGDGHGFKLESNYQSQSAHTQQTFALTYLNERYDIQNLPKTRAKALFPNIHWEYVSTQEKINIQNGWRISSSLSSGLTAENKIQNAQWFTQARMNVKTLYSFSDTLKLRMRFNAAYTHISSLEQLPFSLQLLSGGPLSIRGYRFNSIGPGHSLFTSSVEMQYRLWRSLFGITFFDIGNVTDGNPLQEKPYEGGGVGVAFHSPIGVFTLNIARPLNQQKHPPTMIQFAIGSNL
jgi:translocation and assembly module TamA